MATKLQSERDRMITEAATLSGVQQVVEVYGRIAPYAGFDIQPTTTVVSYSTGGNGA